MNSLPDEVLEMVFQYLSTPMLLGVCVLVCKRWQRVVEFRALVLREEGDEQRLHRRTQSVLVTHTSPVFLIAVLDDIVVKARYLRSLTAHAPIAFREPHVAQLHLMPHLVHLDVFFNPRVLDKRLANVARRLRTLVANEDLAPGLLRVLAAGSQLSALHMFGRSVHCPPRSLLAVLRARRPHLRELTLRCRDMIDYEFEVIGDCYNLRSLQLYSCWRMTAAGARAACRPRLVRRLHVTGARLVLSAELDDVLELLPAELGELALSGGWFGDEHVSTLARHAPGLRTLELWRCKLTGEGAAALAHALPRLRHLDLELKLHKRHLRVLAQHASLCWVRCRQARMGRDPERYLREHPEWEVDGLRLLASYADYDLKYYTHKDSEGFRAALFYYWAQDMPKLPPPAFPYPGLDQLDALFY